MENVSHRNCISNLALGKSTVPVSSNICFCDTDGSGAELEGSGAEPEGSGAETSIVEVTTLEATTPCVCNPVITLSHETKG